MERLTHVNRSIYKSCPSSSAGLKEESTAAPRSDLRLPSPTPSKLHGKEKLGKKGTKVNRKEEKRKGGQSRALQERCVHCHELYSEAENGAGSCRYSPDVLRQGIECMSCLACAKCLLYHCHYEDENFTGQCRLWKMSSSEHFAPQTTTFALATQVTAILANAGSVFRSLLSW